MKQRCWEHDYCSVSFYMITIITEPRRDCLSRLVPASPTFPAAAPGAVPTAAPAVAPSLDLTPIGETVLEVWLRSNTIYSEVEVCESVIMPDHFHGILWVKKRLRRPMGHIVKAFKRVSRQECGSKGLLPQPNHGGLLPQPNHGGLLPQPNHGGLLPQPNLWEEGFHDSILLRRGQLKAMVNYISENPQRLAAKRANPELFTVVSNQRIGNIGTCAMIGNQYLLDHPLKRQVQISRRISSEELAAKQEELIYAAEHGTVLISPCISAGEKAIARAVLGLDKPLIVLLGNGFPPFYKPPGLYFEACASGRLLMLAPFPYQRRKQVITREQCLSLNEWARAIAATS